MKKMFGTKGQGAMEYLMTYGWAILVVMIVGIVMWQLGIFNMGGTTVTATGFAKIKPQLAGTGLTNTGNFIGVFTNGVGTRITLSAGNVDITGDATCTAAADPLTIPAGTNFRIESGAGACTVGTDVAAGEVYDITVSIPYTVVIGGVSTSHTETGTFRGPLE